MTGTGAHRPLTRALGLYFMLLGLSVVGILFVHAGIPELQIDFALTIGFALVVLAWCVVAPGRLVPALRKLVSPLWFVWGSGTALATFAVAYAVIGALQSLTNLPTERMSDVYLENGYGWGMVVLMVCVHPALFEELAFRGVVLDALQPVLSTTEAVLVSSMMFMILHLSPAMFPHTFAMGLGAGLLRVWSGSLLPGMLLHFIHNLLCVVVEAYGWF